MAANRFTAVRAFADQDEPVEVLVATVGTSSPVTLYTDATEATQAPNPVSTDASGSLTFFTDAAITSADLVFVVANATNRVTIPL